MTYIFAGFKARNRRAHLLAELLGFRTSIFGVQLVCQRHKLLNRACNAPPRSTCSSRVAFPINAETSVV